MQKDDFHASDAIATGSLLGSEQEESGIPTLKGKVAKKKPKAGKKKQTVPKDGILNETGVLVSSREYLLEKT